MDFDTDLMSVFIDIAMVLSPFQREDIAIPQPI
jgi:hypothetical protein